MRKEYTHEQKLAYYKRRASDPALTTSQRRFALGFLDGADGTHAAYRYNTTDEELRVFLKKEIPRMEQANKTFRNAAWNGYGQGELSALKDLAAELKRGEK